MNKIIGSYINGNYKVFIYSDGTKVRINDENELIPEFPESIDITISTKCDKNCPFCYIKASSDGQQANLNHPILNSIRPYTELAVGGGGKLLEHPDLTSFLKRMALQKVICNLTVHLDDFIKYYDTIKEYVSNGLLYGIGISVNNDISEEEIKLIKSIPNTVVHIIAGVARYSTFMKLAYHDIKLLILGYKTFGRGEQYFEEHTSISREIDYLRTHMYELRDWFPIISFDNLAIKQLRLREMVSDKEWERTYMGNDGQFTMYVDLVEETFARSSISAREPIGAETDIRNLFNRI